MRAALGYPVTRLIGSTEWADERPACRAPGATRRARRTAPGTARCPHLHLRPHTPQRAHDRRCARRSTRWRSSAASCGPTRSLRLRASARNRLLTAASRLFHEVGIQATGVDSIIAAAGVAKATFYRHFPSKDDLVVAWLRDPRTRWFDRPSIRSPRTRPTATETIPLFFQALADWLEAEGYRGCPYLNTASEITNPAHPARQIIRDYLRTSRTTSPVWPTWPGPSGSGPAREQLQTLTAGAISLAVARRNGDSVQAARRAALEVLASAERKAAAE